MISERERELERQVAKLERINAALIERVESSNLPRIAPYAAFEHAALLAEQVRERTRALNQTLDELRASNRLLGEARKRAEQANQYLVDAIESITDAFVLFGADQRIQHFNSRFAEFWRPAGIEIRAGMSLEELRRLALTSGLVVKEQLKQREGRTVYQLHDGRWVQVNQRPICGGGRVFLYVDITELKRHEHAQREHALAQKSRLLQATLDSLSQGVAVITHGGQLEMHNQRFSQLTGLGGLMLPVALASLEATSELLDPADMQAILPACERRLSDGRVVEVRGHPMPGGGQVLTYTDITERIRQAEAVAERERWIRTITDQVPAMIAYLNRELCYVFTNRVYEEWYGWPHDLPLGSTLGDLHSAEHCARLMPYLQRVLAGERISFELPEQNVAGEQRVLLRAYVPHRDSDGSVIGFFVLVRDITEQRRTAEALHHAYQNLEQRVRERTAELTRVNAQLRGEIEERLAAECQLREAKTEAEAANLSKTKFLAAVSHDLLQPLNAARLFVGALVEQEMSATNLELIQQVGHSLKDVETLLGTLVDISKLDAGVITPEMAPFAIRDLLDGLAREYRQVAASEGLAFHYVPSSAIVRSDISLMARVIRNLLSNAIRYTPGGHLLLGCRRRREGLEIQVLDTGCGIPDEERELIFQEFRRLQTASARDRGLGLGLSIVDKISRMLHQPVRVSSQIGRGTLFGVLLPYAQQLPAGQPRPVVVSGVGRELAGRCLWVVDNDPAICLAMRHLLERWGCKVIVAESETRLSQLACLAEEGADALIVDYHLDHECNGLDLAERINAMRKRPLPVLVITADHSRELRQQVRSLGFQLLNKPVKPLRLRTTLQQLVADAPLEATAGELQGLRR
ncbi:PAS domain-containing protein [Halomonas sp. ANAO-440]|uniref:hybrid sensor histidine kinase/response regulator n=1 Tax=Halomonas sp. ANAO-440 TaxID=2861360 RepID=UPI001CAA4912|nr:PAS domain-containing hybrid sensor histidine kinase/response regulator [Halomonas sp. ANAO-440]MBZ0329483.1 PAS domain-containing protein [Halomonas sp. ANAO-440]